MNNITNDEKVAFVLSQLMDRVERLEKHLGVPYGSTLSADTASDPAARRRRPQAGEHLSVLDLLGDLRAKLETVYDRIFPAFPEFRDELAEFFRQRRG